MIVTKEYLRNNPSHVFVFGDNILRRGRGGAAVLRDEPNTFGFVTKKAPNNQHTSFYRPHEYLFVYEQEIKRLNAAIAYNPHCLFLISKLGAGLANRYGIWEQVIHPNIRRDIPYTNVQYLF